ncbi:histidine phosphatase family protein [Psychromarinibacter sp. S121]|uniref:histidine phosphatase family protein n=1 Tax=Psychromarinibacter sp. S121 TaxID=3415127 RepID=UPI003C7D1FB2
MIEVLFVTHADVRIDPDVPVPDWGLTDRGAARHGRHAQTLDTGPDAIWCSTERKAIEAANIYAGALNLPVQMDPELGENDRSATGFMPKEQFERAADAFFAHPDESYRGWETARAAQSRIVAALARVCATDARRPLIVAHGGVGALLLCHLKGVAIDRAEDQPGGAGGNAYRFTWPEKRLLHGWRDIAPDID